MLTLVNHGDEHTEQWLCAFRGADQLATMVRDTDLAHRSLHCLLSARFNTSHSSVCDMPVRRLILQYPLTPVHGGTGAYWQWVRAQLGNDAATGRFMRAEHLLYRCLDEAPERADAAPHLRAKFNMRTRDFAYQSYEQYVHDLRMLHWHSLLTTARRLT